MEADPDGLIHREDVYHEPANLLASPASPVDDGSVVSAACLADMQAAANVPDLEDEFKNEELWPAFASCTSVAEWEAARIAAGIQPPFDAGHIEPECGFNPAVAGTPLCRAVANVRG